MSFDKIQFKIYKFLDKVHFKHLLFVSFFEEFNSQFIHFYEKFSLKDYFFISFQQISIKKFIQNFEICSTQFSKKT